MEKIRWNWQVIPKLSNKLDDWHALMMCLLFGHFVFVCVLGLWWAGMLQELELFAYDQGLRWQALSPPDGRIVLIGETENDIQRWGYPISDGVLADVLDHLTQGRPRVIGVDKYRDHPVPLPPGSDHERLNQLLRHHPEIVWVTKFGNSTPQDPFIAPPSVLEGTDQIGFCDFPQDKDGLIRRGFLYLDNGQQRFTSFSLAVALRYLRSDDIFPQADSRYPKLSYLRLGATMIRPLAANEGGYVHVDDRGYQYILDYRGRLDAKKVYNLTDVLEGRLPVEQLSDKIVLLGGMAASVPDYFQIPVRRFLAGEPTVKAPARDLAGRIAGVALHALQVNQLLRFALAGDSPIRGLSNSAETGWLWFWCLIGVGLALWRLRFGWLLALMAGALTILMGVWQLAFHQQIWLPLAAPMLGLTISTALSSAYLLVYEHAERKLLTSLFACYTPPEIAHTLWRERRRLIASKVLSKNNLNNLV